MTTVSTVAKGDGSGVTTARRVVIRDDRAWRALWTEHAGDAAAAPRVEFGTQIIAAVFAGDRPTPGYGIEITGLHREGDSLAIVVTESRPAPGTLAAQVIVTPFHIVALPRFEGSVSFV
jgi:hypothetical protein